MATNYGYGYCLLYLVWYYANSLWLYTAPQLPYSRAGFTRVNLSGGDFIDNLTGKLGVDLSRGLNGDVSGDASSWSPLGALLVQSRHEDDGGGAFAAVVLGAAQHPFSLAAWGRAELEHVEEGAMPATAPKRRAQPSDFALLVDLWLLDSSHRSGLHAPFTPNESRWHLALLEVDPHTSHNPCPKQARYGFGASADWPRLPPTEHRLVEAPFWCRGAACSAPCWPNLDGAHLVFVSTHAGLTMRVFTR